MKSQGAAKNEANNAARSTSVAAKVVAPAEETTAPAKGEIDFSNVEVEPLFEDMVYFDTFSKSDFRAGKVKECEAVAPAEETTAPAKGEIDFSNVEVEPLFEDMVYFDTFSKSDFRAGKVKECEAVPKSKKLLKFLLDDGSGEDRVILSGIHDYYEPEFLVGKTFQREQNCTKRVKLL